MSLLYFHHRQQGSVTWRPTHILRSLRSLHILHNLHSLHSLRNPRSLPSCPTKVHYKWMQSIYTTLVFKAHGCADKLTREREQISGCFHLDMGTERRTVYSHPGLIKYPTLQNDERKVSKDVLNNSYTPPHWLCWGQFCVFPLFLLVVFKCQATHPYPPYPPPPLNKRKNDILQFQSSRETSNRHEESSLFLFLSHSLVLSISLSLSLSLSLHETYILVEGCVRAKQESICNSTLNYAKYTSFLVSKYRAQITKTTHDQFLPSWISNVDLRENVWNKSSWLWHKQPVHFSGI